MSEANGKLSAALVAAQAEMPMIGFDADNPFFRSRYASLGAVISGTTPILKKYGLAIRQVPTTDGCTVSVQTTILHASGETLDGGTLSMDIGDVKGKALIQEIGSVITYFKRYAWSCACGVYSDEDTDGNTSDQQHGKEPEPTKAKARVARPVEMPLPTAKTRLWALNKLQAAPGQPNRELVTQFFEYRGWIAKGAEPENWPLDRVTASMAAVDLLSAEITQWDVDRHQPL